MWQGSHVFGRLILRVCGLGANIKGKINCQHGGATYLVYAHWCGAPILDADFCGDLCCQGPILIFNCPHPCCEHVHGY